MGVSDIPEEDILILLHRWREEVVVNVQGGFGKRLIELIGREARP